MKKTINSDCYEVNNSNRIYYILKVYREKAYLMYLKQANKIKIKIYLSLHVTR